MTSKLTREWLQHQISAIEAVGITDSNTLAAFKLALAAMDGESVAWQIHTPETGVTYVETKQQSVENIRNGYGIKVEITPLYRHAQQPVVPDERAAFNAWNNEDNLPIAGVGAKNAAWLAWQARAVMAGNSPLWVGVDWAKGCEPANSPVIPDRWIPVSERMPEERETVVLVADERGIVWCAEIQDGEIYPDEFPGTRGFGCAEATHWMPLPAAPQEVSHG
ncbi:TPA: DUF551 domain-containing protein [Klebsiella michiganensis]|nr:DUF551 domain-containing protein [Klebsiella michiganensis]HCB1849083.1 DUF551 domain-containing protein [Klebsiella oxytoca]